MIIFDADPSTYTLVYNIDLYSSLYLTRSSAVLGVSVSLSALQRHECHQSYHRNVLTSPPPPHHPPALPLPPPLPLESRPESPHAH